VFEKGFLAPLVMEELKERSEIKTLVRWEKFRKMRTVCLGFSSKDIVIVTKFVSKHGHPGLRGTSFGHTSSELPHVGYCDEIYRRLDRMKQSRATG
jgi:hypothetical protein